MVETKSEKSHKIVPSSIGIPAGVVDSFKACNNRGYSSRFISFVDISLESFHFSPSPFASSNSSWESYKGTRWPTTIQPRDMSMKGIAKQTRGRKQEIQTLQVPEKIHRRNNNDLLCKISPRTPHERFSWFSPSVR